MKVIWLYLLLITSFSFAQSIDFNTQKGFVAEGYDVVSYFDNIAEEGQKDYTTTYDGVIYKFASKAHLETFKTNPEKYQPQYGGYCAYAIADKGKKVSVDPKTFLVTDGKLYLFYNAWGTNTLKLWNKENPEILKQKADKNWIVIRNK